MDISTPPGNKVDPIAQLDTEVAQLRSHALAESTKKCYKSHLKCYTDFCAQYHITPVPATPTTICRYIAHLARTKAFSTIQQYISVIRLIHLEVGLPHPFKDSFQVTSLMKGVRRVKPGQKYKDTLSLSQIKAMRSHLDLSDLEDLQIWVMIVTCFFALLRISAVTVPNVTDFDHNKTLTRGDITFLPNGLVLKIKHSKTNQYGDRVFEATLPRIPDITLCPASAAMLYLAVSSPLPDTTPALSYKQKGQLYHLTPNKARKRLQSLIQAIGLDEKEYGTHSLRRSGATYLLSQGVPLETIKVVGDWSPNSNCVYKYLRPSGQTKLDSLCNNSYYQS